MDFICFHRTDKPETDPLPPCCWKPMCRCGASARQAQLDSGRLPCPAEKCSLFCLLVWNDSRSYDVGFVSSGDLPRAFNERRLPQIIQVLSISRIRLQFLDSFRPNAQGILWVVIQGKSLAPCLSTLSRNALALCQESGSMFFRVSMYLSVCPGQTIFGCSVDLASSLNLSIPTQTPLSSLSPKDWPTW